MNYSPFKHPLEHIIYRELMLGEQNDIQIENKKILQIAEEFDEVVKKAANLLHIRTLNVYTCQDSNVYVELKKYDEVCIVLSKGALLSYEYEELVCLIQRACCIYALDNIDLYFSSPLFKCARDLSADRLFVVKFKDAKRLENCLYKCVTNEDSASSLVDDSDFWIQNMMAGYGWCTKSMVNARIDDLVQYLKNRNQVMIEPLFQKELEIEIDGLNQQIENINCKLKSYEMNVSSLQCSLALLSGFVWGILDQTILRSDFEKNNREQSIKKIEIFIKRYCAVLGIKDQSIGRMIKELEQCFKVSQDDAYHGVKHVVPRNHHLADLAHHPTPVGLLASILVQFTKIATFINKDGKIQIVFVNEQKKSNEEIKILKIVGVLSGVLNWLSYLESNTSICPETHGVIALLRDSISNTKKFLPIVMACNRWFGHLISDIDGTNKNPGAGMGIPGIFMSMLYEMSCLPGIRNTELANQLNDLYANHYFDFREEFHIYETLVKQSRTVLGNDLTIRLIFMFTELLKQLNKDQLDISKIIPFKNRNCDWLLTLGSLTFTMVDLSDAIIQTILCNPANPLKIFTKINYVGAGKMIVEVYKETLYQEKELALLLEKSHLMRCKTNLMFSQYYMFEKRLEEEMKQFIFEDLDTYIKGVTHIQQGLKTNNSNLVISGNNSIQKQLGYECLFETQAEFDQLMDCNDELSF